MKTITFTHAKFKPMEIDISDGRALFSNNYLKDVLKPDNKELPYCSDTQVLSDGKVIDVLVCLNEVFEYIRFSTVDNETLWLFEEWLAETIVDCAKLLQSRRK